MRTLDPARAADQGALLPGLRHDQSVVVMRHVASGVIASMVPGQVHPQHRLPVCEGRLVNPPARSGPGIGEQAIDPAELLGRSDTPPGPPPEAVCFPSQAGPVGGRRLSDSRLCRGLRPQGRCYTARHALPLPLAVDRKNLPKIAAASARWLGRAARPQTIVYVTPRLNSTLAGILTPDRVLFVPAPRGRTSCGPHRSQELLSLRPPPTP